MSTRADSLRSEALALSEAERAELIVDLLDSLDDRPLASDEDDIERIWAEETTRRAAQIDSGEVVTDSWEDVLARVDRARPNQ